MKNLTVFAFVFFVCTIAFSGCDWAKEKTKKGINKTGELVGKAGSEFGNGIYKGVKKTFENEVKISDELKNSGVALGEFTIASTDTTNNNVLTAYMIFNKNFEKQIKVKLLDGNEKEYGRTEKNVKANKGSAQYVDFVFDKRVNIHSKGNILIE